MALASALSGTAASNDESGGTDVATYRGEITRQRNLEFFAALDPVSTRRLVITSSGGSVEAGIELGRRVDELGLDVEVDRYCLSSCANYVFPAARNKTIRENAFVAWHGNYIHLLEAGLWTDDIAPRMARYGEDEDTARDRARREAQRLADLERQFFEDIGVDELLCRRGKMPPYDVPDYFLLSPRDMARFGVQDVRAPAGYPDTVRVQPDFDLVTIRLEEP